MNSRTIVLLIICLLFSLVWVIYLFILSAYDPFDLGDIQRRRYDLHKEIMVANRGNIYDRNGRLLVSTLKNYQIDIDLNRTRAIASRTSTPLGDLYQTIAKIIGENSHLNTTDVYNRLVNARGATIVISENIDEDQLLSIRSAFVAENLHILTCYTHFFTSVSDFYYISRDSFYLKFNRSFFEFII